MNAKTAKVYADSAGTLADSQEDVVVLTSLICYEPTVRQVSARYDHLKKTVARWGVDVQSTDFEFHAYEVFSRRKQWRGLSHEQVARIGEMLRKAITEPRLSYVMVKVDKNKNGLSGLRLYHDFIVRTREEAVSQIPDDVKTDIGDELKRRHITRGFGRMADLSALLLGATSSLMHREGFKGSATLIVDEQFLMALPAWSIVFEANNLMWPLLHQSNAFRELQGSQRAPKWHLGEEVHSEESHRHFGLQLADFIAYTVKRSQKLPVDLATHVMLQRDEDFVPFEDYPGMFLTTSARRRERRIRTTRSGLRTWRS